MKKTLPFLIEFFMVFLGVFCGFVADNQREAMADREAEINYIKALREDLRKDTTEIRQSLKKVQQSIQYNDSLLFYLYSHVMKESVPVHFAQLDLYGVQRLDISFVNRTEVRLTTSGDFQLIRSSAVSDALLAYWNQQKKVLTSLDRYLIYRNRAREKAEGLYYFGESQLAKNGVIQNKVKGLEIITDDERQWKEYQNIVARCGAILPGHAEDLEQALSMAQQLIELTNQEYPEK